MTTSRREASVVSRDVGELEPPSRVCLCGSGVNGIRIAAGILVFEATYASRRRAWYGSGVNSKFLILVGLTVGSTAGSFIPALWGADWFSMWSVFLGMLGGLAGIWAGYKLSRL